MSTQQESSTIQEEKKSFLPPPGQQPNVNTQKKTDDVLNTTGMSFEDFNISQDLHLVGHLT